MDTNGPLEQGATVGPYTIVGRIGEGGMGEVYRAHDPKLRRDVAIKVIRSGLTGDPDRHVRFEREARILAALRHPNIATVYGLEDAGSRPALVMELVEGPTLADRLRQGPIPLDDALRLAGQIAEAVEYAHERSIVHRDLKPANVKLTSDGAVKILDFGLAKALTPDALTDASADIPTVTGGLTEIGAILGTPAYMSPEQATGRPPDRRTDVWAFGCVLYEMLTGVRPFVGERATDTLAAAPDPQPDWSRLPARTPPDVRTILQRCLRKDPRQRLQAIGDARVAIGEALTGATSAPAIVRPSAASSTRQVGWGTIGAVALAAVAAIAAWQLKPAPVSSLPVRSFTIALPADQRLAALERGTLAFAEDGSQLAYVAADATGQRIYLRAMETGATVPVPGTNGATTPFFSPDGQWLGFFADGRLKKVPLEGGVVTTLTDVPSAFGATWSTQHTIVFASLWSVLEQISDAGGAPRDLTGFTGTENSHSWPRAVPGRQSVLFASAGPASRTIALEGLAGSGHRDLVSGGGVSFPSYVASGHLLYLQGEKAVPHGENLMTVSIDLAQGRTEGDPVLALQHVRQYAVSSAGSLAYASGSPPDGRSRLVWVSRTGTPQVIDDRADNYYQPRVDPVRGDRFVTDVNDQVWMFDGATRNLTPFTFGDRNQHAIWTRDGRQLVFMTQKGRTWQLSRQPADGNSKPEAIRSDAGRLDIPYSLTPQGALAFVQYSGTAESQMWILPLHAPDGGTGPSQQVFSIPIADAEAGPAFSPDGHWLAYAGSDANGRRQIYVQPYPGPGGKHQVSIDGGNEPLWNPAAGRQTLELFYRSGDDMMAVDITTRDGFGQGKPHRLFSGAAGYQPVVPNYVRANYDVSPDGQRFLMLQPVGQKDSPITEIHVVLNWGERLKQLAPAHK